MLVSQKGVEMSEAGEVGEVKMQRSVTERGERKKTTTRRKFGVSQSLRKIETTDDIVSPEKKKDKRDPARTPISTQNISPTFNVILEAGMEAKKPAAKIMEKYNIAKKHKLNMPYRKKFIHAEYVWIGGSNTCDVRSKSKTMQFGDTPSIWNYDGSSTRQAEGHDSEVLIKPVRIYQDPFRSENDILVLCETMKNGEAHQTNYRERANACMKAAAKEEPMFGIEQEFFVIDNATGKAVGWPSGEQFCPRAQGTYHCGVDGTSISKALRKYYEDAIERLRQAGIPITGGNFETAPGQLEVQICDIGIALCDHVWMTRYILQRTAQEHNFGIEFQPKPYTQGNWNGSGAHCNFSTKSMRAPGGFAHIMDAIKKLEVTHEKHIACYGSGNKARLTGKCETACWKKFTYGVGNRGSSIRIPVDTQKNQMGYLEDRRPSSSMNPYIVCGMLVQTSLGVCPEVEFPSDLE